MLKSKLRLKFIPKVFIWCLIAQSRNIYLTLGIEQYWGSPGGAVVKNACQCRRHGDVGSIPGSGRSPGVGNGNPLQCSFL